MAGELQRIQSCSVQRPDACFQGCSQLWETAKKLNGAQLVIAIEVVLKARVRKGEYGYHSHWKEEVQMMIFLRVVVVTH